MDEPGRCLMEDNENCDFGKQKKEQQQMHHIIIALVDPSILPRGSNLWGLLETV